MTTTVLLSGGLDSAALLAWLKAQTDVDALAIDYGQRHGVCEIGASHALADHYGVAMEVVHLQGLARSLRGSRLTDGAGTDVVPNRNAVLLSIAAGHALARRHDRVAIATNATDHGVFADCRPRFLAAMDQATQASTEGRVRVIAPFMELSKAEVARHAVLLGVPVGLTWSCYQPAGEQHCGQCGACVERARALDAATNGADPTSYAKPLVEH